MTRAGEDTPTLEIPKQSMRELIDEARAMYGWTDETPITVEEEIEQ
jgi:hypothetical protein